MMVSFNDLSKDYKGKLVFENITGRINSGEKIGLIGRNGVGKTTLARIIAALEEYEKGSLSYSPSHLKIRYLNPNEFFFEKMSKEILLRNMAGNSRKSMHSER